MSIRDLPMFARDTERLWSLLDRMEAGEAYEPAAELREILELMLDPSDETPATPDSSR